MTLFWPTCEDVKHACWFGSPDLRCDKWACKKPADYLDESAHFQDLREDDNSASEITYGEVEQRLGQLQEHLNRYTFVESADNWTVNPHPVVNDCELPPECESKVMIFLFLFLYVQRLCNFFVTPMHVAHVSLFFLVTAAHTRHWYWFKLKHFGYMHGYSG